MNKFISPRATFVLALGSALLMSACAQQPQRAPPEARAALSDKAQPERIDKTRRAELPQQVQDDLRGSPLTADRERLSSTGRAQEPRFTVQANNIEASEFFASLAADSPYSIVVHPDVKGKVSVSLKDVTIAETLAVVEDIYGYDVRESERIIRVLPAGLRSETIPLDYLSLRRIGL